MPGLSFWMRSFLVLLWALSVAKAGFQCDSEQNRWRLDNGRIEAVFQLTPAGAFQLQSLTDLSSKDTWTAPESAPSSPLRFLVGSRWYDAQTPFRLLSQGVQRIPGPGYRQSIVLEDLEGEGGMFLISSSAMIVSTV